MDTSLVFGLGVASAVVVIIVIALVVATLMLMSKVKGIQEALTIVERNTEEAYRHIDSEITDALATAKSYTDSRIDKMTVSK